MPENLGRVQANLTNQSMASWFARATEYEYDIMLPKFQMRLALNLVSALQQLGMKTAFDKNSADFSSFSELKPLFIESIEHQATIDVDEFGTTAAAATEVSAATKSAGPSFIVNRPFLVVIRSRQTGAIVFIGKVLNPAA